MVSEGPSAGNILVVDDTVENLNLLSSILGQEGYEVRPVPSGNLALQAISLEPPEIILLDVNMSPLSGYDVCARLKHDPSTKDIPIIFVSALDETVDKVRAFSLGAVDYVTKPFQVPEVIARVKTHLQLRRTQMALEESHDQLRQLEAMRDDLVHMIVHDLRSPLTALTGNITLVREELQGRVSEEIIQDLDAGEAAARMMIGMANDLLDVSRLEIERLPLNPTRADLLSVVESAVENIRRMQAERTVLIEAEGPVHGWFDTALIRRVVENLVSNGLKHTPSEHPLRVHVSCAPELRVVVRDRGQGVPEEYREKIFEKFGMTHARRDRAYHSAGLGLAFCKLAVEAHGGEIGVDCTDGDGSAFWFSIPGRQEA